MLRRVQAGVYVDAQAIQRKRADGVLVDAHAAYITVSGVKRQVWPERKYIIRNGVQDNAITGGWKWIKVVGTPAATWKNGYLELTNQYDNGSTNYYITQKTIPLDGKSVLCITLEVTTNGELHGQHIGLWNSNSFAANKLDGQIYACNFLQSNIQKQTIRIPFYAATGKYLGIGVEAIGGTTVLKVYDVWLEK